MIYLRFNPLDDFLQKQDGVLVMYWDMVLKEVLRKNSKNQKVIFTNLCKNPKLRKKTKQGRVLNMYPLGENYNNLYLTRREAECMMWLLRGEKISSIAKELKLSPRTIEFYFKNIKHKLGCRTKFELKELVANSEFMQHVDFEYVNNGKSLELEI